MENNKKLYMYKSFILLQCLIWGIGNPVTKIGLNTITPFYCLTMRFTLAFLVFILFFGKKIKEDLTKESLPGLFIICLFNAVSFIFSTLSLQATAANISGFLMALSVVFTPLLSAVVLKKKTNLKVISSIAIVVAGMYFLCGNSGQFQFGLGELFALLSSVSLAITLIYSSKHVCTIGPMVISSAQAGFTALVSFIFALFFEDSHILFHVSASGWGALIYLALGCTCIAYMLQNCALKQVSAVFVSLAFCMEPIFTALASYPLLGETLSLKGISGAVLILTGTIIASVLPSYEEEKMEPVIELTDTAPAQNTDCSKLLP